MKYSLIIFKRIIEDIIIYPFVLYGRYLSRKNPLKDQYEIYFFFPFYHIGGAEKVHLAISKALSNRKSIIIFTKKSQDSKLLPAFQESGHYVIDISAYTDNKFKYWNNLIYRGLVSGHINHQNKKKLIFNGQSNFAYKLSRWISKDVPQIELIHSFSNFSYIRIPFIGFYDKTIMISKKRIKDHLELYQRCGIPQQFSDRIEFILNGIPLPIEKPLPKLKSNSPLRILYVGRGTDEKRIPLLSQIIFKLIESGIPIHTTFIGELVDIVPPEFRKNIHFIGSISDPDQLDAYYRQSDVLLMVSSSEGFPLTIMEAMARGCVIISTGVGDIPFHVLQNENGFIFSQYKNEKLIIEESEIFIKKIMNDRDLFEKISFNNIEYAYTHFGMNIFSEKYQKLIETHLD